MVTKKNSRITNVQNQALSFAIRLKVIGKCYGQLAIAIGVLTAVPALFAIVTYNYEIAFRLCVVTCFFLGVGLCTQRIIWPSRLQVNESMVVIAMAFLTVPLAMTWPLMAENLNFTDAFFEAVSAVTTTGLTLTSQVESKSEGFLFARAWMQWYGGLGFVVLIVAFVINPSSIAKRLAISEVDTQSFAGGNRSHFQRILLVYISLTLICVLCVFASGTNLFNALLYSFAAVSTGGFAPDDTSLAPLPKISVTIIILTCFLASFPLFLFYELRKGHFVQLFKDPQIQAICVLCLLVGFGLVLAMHISEKYSVIDAIFHGAVTAVSAQSTAGFSSISISSLEPITKVLIIFSMFIGGSIGSTAGGIKVLRFLVFLAVLRTFLQRTSMPHHAVANPRLRGEIISETEIRGALMIITLMAFVIFVSWLLFLAWGQDPINSLFEIISATCTVGLSAGITNPELPDILKYVLCANMLLGRIELIAWIILFYPSTWIGRKRQYSEI